MIDRTNLRQECKDLAGYENIYPVKIRKKYFLWGEPVAVCKELFDLVISVPGTYERIKVPRSRIVRYCLWELTPVEEGEAE